MASGPRPDNADGQSPMRSEGAPAGDAGSGSGSPGEHRDQGERHDVEPAYSPPEHTMEETILLDVNPMVRYPLLLFNLALWFIGMMLMTGASYVYFSSDLYEGDEAVLLRFDLTGVLIHRLETVVFIAGVALFVVSFCGCVGALRENSFLLKLYSLSLTVLIMISLMLGLVVFFMPGSVRRVIKETLSESLVIHYRDTVDTQNLVDSIQRQLHCCGMTYRSFRDWDKNIYFSCSVQNPSHERCSVPHSCCKGASSGLSSIYCGRNVLNMSDYDAWFIVHIASCPDAAHRYVKEHVMVIGGSCLIAVILLSFVDMITNAVIDEIDIICKIYSHVQAAAAAAGEP